MKLAKATQAEIDTLMAWLQDLEAKKFEDAKHRPPPFARVVFGYDMLVKNVCDPDKDYLDWKPGYSPKEVNDLRERTRRLVEFAELIRDAGGTTTKEGLTCNGSWCAEQARVFLAGAREEKTL